MKKIPSIVYYLAIAALLGGYIYFFERGPVKTDADKDKDKKKISMKKKIILKVPNKNKNLLSCFILYFLILS